MRDPTELAHRFEGERPRLRGIAVRLLGSVADAEDAVQEAWLRLERVDPDTIDELGAWLTTVVSRISLDQLRGPRRTRELSWDVEPWYEPTSDTPDPADLADRGDQVSVALLVLLDRLSPAERLAFVLHDVFGEPFEEIAVALDRSSDAVRQLASRARRRIRGAGTEARADGAESRRMISAWLAAAQEGDFSALLELLDDGSVLTAEYAAGLQSIVGATAIAEQAVLSARLAAHSTPVLIGGRPGVAVVFQGRVVSLMAFETRDGRIVALDVLADPARMPDRLP